MKQNIAISQILKRWYTIFNKHLKNLSLVSAPLRWIVGILLTPHMTSVDEKSENADGLIQWIDVRSCPQFYCHQHPVRDEVKLCRNADSAEIVINQFCALVGYRTAEYFLGNKKALAKGIFMEYHIYNMFHNFVVLVLNHHKTHHSVNSMHDS